MSEGKPKKAKKSTAQVRYEYEFEFPFPLYEVLGQLTHAALEESLKKAKGDIVRASALLRLQPSDYVKLLTQYGMEAKIKWVS